MIISTFSTKDEMRSQACKYGVGQIEKFEEKEESMKLFYQRANNRLPRRLAMWFESLFEVCGHTFEVKSVSPFG